MTTDSDSDVKSIGYHFFLYRREQLLSPFAIALQGKATEDDPCGWDPLDEDTLFAQMLGLACFLRSCALSSTLKTGDEVTDWPDESGLQNNMTDVSNTPVPVFDGKRVLFDRSAAAIQCQHAYTFQAHEWSWFFTLRMSSLSDRLTMQIFSVLATFIPRPDSMLAYSWSQYIDEFEADSPSGSFSEAEMGCPITDWLSRIILCVRSRIINGVWYSSLRINGHDVREWSLEYYSDSRRTVSLSWFPAAAGHTMSLRQVLGFDRYLDDAACAAVETILKKYAEAA